eukprot:2480047-Alexandrium_andersonii.AAC.1
MSASLVGSEMCIRDRSQTARSPLGATAQPWWDALRVEGHHDLEGYRWPSSLTSPQHSSASRVSGCAGYGI